MPCTLNPISKPIAYRVEACTKTVITTVSFSTLNQKVTSKHVTESHVSIDSAGQLKNEDSRQSE